MATLQTRLSDLITSLGTDWKNLWAAIGTIGDLDTTATDLVEAVNEVKVTADAAGGGVDTLDELTDVVITSPVTGHILRHNNTNFVNVLGTTHFDAAGSAAAAQSASQPVDSDLTSIAALTTTSYGRAFLELANQAATMALLSDATASAKGIVELATDGETTTGTDTVRATTPANVAAAITARVASLTAAGIVELATTAETTTGTDTTRAVTPAGVAAAVAALINSAPGALDTLDELAAAIGDDANFAATMTTALAGKQPIDSDLTSIAALTTTSYGRALLELANQAALTALIAPSSETVVGIIELATQAETNTGTDDARAVTPLKFQTRFTALIGNPDTDLVGLYDTAKA